MNFVDWPEMTFGPINLWALPPAWWWYMTKEERYEYNRLVACAVRCESPSVNKIVDRLDV